ncbi:MAG: RnfABCDGE type electron transport complex subunit G [Bacteroidales bacterium]|nr:RnfABCDGE type electron transport complex subunit G [Bacteroidales bacterium]
MANKESTFTNMVLTLFIVTLAASTTLGFIYELTREPIAKAKLRKKNMAIRQVVPEFSNQPNNDSYKVAVEGDSLQIYPAEQDGELVGLAVSSFTDQGFSGRIRIMVGFKSDGTINNISVLEHAETPGLGDKIEKAKSDWSTQFNGKNPENFDLQVQKDGGDVDAITAATISSRAYCDAVQRAYKAFQKGGAK